MGRAKITNLILQMSDGFDNERGAQGRKDICKLRSRYEWILCWVGIELHKKIRITKLREKINR